MSGEIGSELFGSSPADAVFDQMVDMRRAVHRRPELAFEEHFTTSLIRDHMASLGIDEALRVTETGGIFAMDGGGRVAPSCCGATSTRCRCRSLRRHGHGDRRSRA